MSLHSRDASEDAGRSDGAAVRVNNGVSGDYPILDVAYDAGGRISLPAVTASDERTGQIVSKEQDLAVSALQETLSIILNVVLDCLACCTDGVRLRLYFRGELVISLSD